MCQTEYENTLHRKLLRKKIGFRTSEILIFGVLGQSEARRNFAYVNIRVAQFKKRNDLVQALGSRLSRLSRYIQFYRNKVIKR